jgi:hypothetical protein
MRIGDNTGPGHLLSTVANANVWPYALYFLSRLSF